MKTITKYNNRKLYDKEASKYISLNALVQLPMGSFQVVDKETGADITLDTLFAYLASSSDPFGVNKDTKVKVLQHCINLLSV